MSRFDYYSNQEDNIMLFKFRNFVISLVCATLALSAIPAVSAQKGAIGHVEASMLELAGPPPSVDVEAANKAGIKDDPFVGLTHLQRPDESQPAFVAIENQPAPDKPFNGPHVTKLVINPDGNFTREWLYTGFANQEYVSLALAGEWAFVTTLGGEVVIINLTNGDSVTYHGLTPGIKYGIILDDPSLEEVGVYDVTDSLRRVHYLSRSAARFMRTEEPQAVSAGCATIMALGLRRVWDLDFRSSTGSTRRYLVVDGGNSFPLLAPRLLQVSYDYNTSASSVTVIATGPAGDNWFGGDLVGNDFYVATKAGSIKRIDVNTGNIFLVSATALDPNFYTDLIIRTEGGVRQIYSVGYQGRFRKTNGNTGVTVQLAQMPGSAHSIALDASGNSFVMTGSIYESGFKAVVWKVTTSGAVTVFAKGTANGSFSFYGIVTRASNTYDVINNSTGSVLRVNSFAGPWTVVCQSSGGQNQELIRDGSRRVLGDYSQGSIQFY